MLFTLRSKLLRFVAVAGLAAVQMAASAYASEKVLHAFRGGKDGATPSGSLVADSAGDLYGATWNGGSGTQCHDTIAGCGTLYEITKSGGESVLYSFQGESDGGGPSGPLLLDNSGNLYGTADGGAGTNCVGYGCGVVFKFAPGGIETVLYTFQGGADGELPSGGVISDNNGNLYGITGEGGSFSNPECTQYGCGTVFKVQPDGTKTTLHTFLAGNDGAYPNTGLVADSSGNFYGVTHNGGGSACNGSGCGTVFKVTPDGTETVLYSFQGNSDGELPLGGVIIDAAGNLYGTTMFGGANNGGAGAGTVFEVSPSGSETVIYAFKGGSDGANPRAGLTTDNAGNLFGTTWSGGNGPGCKPFNGCGVVFEIAADGTETVLHTFDKKKDRRDGLFPLAGLLLGQHGDLYGTTSGGGKRGDGVVFELKK